MGKRKSEQVDESTKDEPRRSSRRIARAAGSASTRPAATPTRAQPKKSGVNGVAKDLPDKPEPKPGVHLPT